MLTSFVAFAFFLLGALVAYWGFAHAISDIQLILGAVGLFAAGQFLVLASIGGGMSGLRQRLQKLEDQVVEARKPAAPQQPSIRLDAAADFNGALAAYQNANGIAEASSAIKDLASDALRRGGFLR